MAISNSRLLNLERKLTNLLSPGNELKPIPADFSEFVKNCEIRSGGSMAYFVPYKYQEILVNLRKEYKNIVIIKSRQLGVTQVLSAMDLWTASRFKGTSAAYFMKNQEDSSALSRRIKTMIKGLKEYIQPENDSVSYIKIKNGGDIYIKNSSRGGLRSLDSISSQVYDECCFIPDVETIYGASNASSAMASVKG